MMQGITALFFIPWLLYALRSSAQITAFVIKVQPTPPHLWDIWEQLGIIVNVGDMVRMTEARWVGLGVGLLTVAGLCGRWRANIKFSGIGVLVISYLLLPLGIASVFFFFRPYFVRPRFFLFLTPVYLFALAWVLVKGWDRKRWFGFVATLMVGGLLIHPLNYTYYVQENLVEANAIQVANFMDKYLRPGDGAIFQGFWQLGYFHTNLGSRAPYGYDLMDVGIEDMPRLFQRHSRVWLAMYKAETWDPRYPLEEWLDRNAYKVINAWVGDTRLGLYTMTTVPLVEAPQRVNFGNKMDLVSSAWGLSSVRSGDIIPVWLRWRVLERPQANYTVFVHLTDARGNSWPGFDSEPVNGLRPTSSWQSGEEIEDRHGFLVAWSVPPGPYVLTIGLYDPQIDQRLPMVDESGQVVGDVLSLGTVVVDGLGGEDVFVRNSKSVAWGDGLELLGYTLSSDQWRPGRSIPIKTAEGLSGLTLPDRYPKSGDLLLVTLYWRAQTLQVRDYWLLLRLVDKEGRVGATLQGPPVGGLYPTPLWPPGGIVVEEEEITIDQRVSAGRYFLEVSLYDPGSEKWLPLGSSSNSWLRLAEVKIALGD
ncbi:MAG: hypothetical protein HY664_04210 [Chloroflexi bacterium]|nr:hypothetical protein [Chloroflexota bacterium]